MSDKLDFYFDYACPWCYIGSHTVRELSAEGAEVDYHVWKMPPNANPPAKPEGYYDAARARLKELREEMGVTVSSPVQSDTVPALIATKVAEQFGAAERFVEAVFKAHWAEKKDIADRDVLVALAEQVGLNGGEFRAALDKEAGQAGYEQDLHTAQERVIDTIPSYLNGEKQLLIHHFAELPTLEDLRKLSR
ncbi:MAG: DsbA family oxidoreductase [Tumebacillaceae bacterium]